MCNELVFVKIVVTVVVMIVPGGGDEKAATDPEDAKNIATFVKEQRDLVVLALRRRPDLTLSSSSVVDNDGYWSVAVMTMMMGF